MHSDKNDPVNSVRHSNKRREKYNETLAEAIELIRRIELRQHVPNYKYKELAEKLIDAMEIDDRKIEPYLMLAEIYRQVGETDLAFKYLKLARDIDPEHPMINEIKNLIIQQQLKL
jgi:Tfp pilus assembly protein PilF